MGMFVRPFALTMRLAANMTGGYRGVAVSFVFIFAELFARAGADWRRHRALAAARGRHL
jgi:F0F1-type ATP synthase membrane subunit a